MSWLNILTACFKASNSFSFLYPPVHFLCKWLSAIIALTNNNGDSTPPWNIPLWILTSAKLLPPAVNSTLHVSMIFSIIIIIIILLFESFYASTSWYESLIRSPGLFSVFKLILEMLWSEWSRFFLLLLLLLLLLLFCFQINSFRWLLLKVIWQQVFFSDPINCSNYNQHHYYYNYCFWRWWCFCYAAANKGGN